ncbi:MAG: metal ABC transporter ATP-binding protein [Phycisphaeraceae bacterium]
MAHNHHHDCDHDHDHAAVADDLAHHAAQDLICLHNVGYRFPSQGGAKSSGAVALRDVTLHISRGENLGIIGPNGAGKTTLLKIILGLLEGYTGSVEIMNMSPREAGRRGDVIGYVPQRAEVEWKFPVSAEQVVMMGLTGKTGLFRRHKREDREYALEMMRRVGMIDLRDRPIGHLSGGQQQRLFIARALAARPPILILDEPLVGIDEAGQRQFARLIHELHESLKLTVVIVSHDLQAIAAGCNRVACLKQSIHYHAAPSGLTKEVLSEVFNHEIAPVLTKAK